MRRRAFVFAWMLLVVSGLRAAPVVALMTDFGLRNEAVGLCHGAILSVNSDIRVVDLCHEVDAYDINLAALMLRGTTVFPKGSVFVAVIDPGVGTSRDAVAVKTKSGYYYVGPNNGILTYMIKDQGVEQAVLIDAKRVNPKWEPGTFDGRDLFSPAGAMLAVSGDLSSVGVTMTPEKLLISEVKAPVVDLQKKSVTGTYVRTDEPYGNVWTDITRDDLTSIGLRTSDRIRVSANGKNVEMPLVISFGHVPKGKPLAYFNSTGTLAFAINMGDFRRQYGLEKGVRVRVGAITAQNSPPKREGHEEKLKSGR